MVRFIIRRLLGVVVLLLVVLAITFGIFFLIPADPALQSCGKQCTPVRLAQIHHKLGLDKPLYQQFDEYAVGVVAGRDFGDKPNVTHCSAPCFGYSFQTDQPVWQMMMQRFPITLSIAVGAAILWLIVGVAVGILSALKRGSILDRSSMTFALAGVSLPIPFVGLLLLYFFAAKWKILPYPLYASPWHHPVQWAKAMVLPWITLAILYSALYARLTRANMLDTMGEDYIRTARAKGLRESVVVRRHGLRAALTPIVTIFGLDLGALLGGAILTEQVFGLPGLGTLAVSSVIDSNLPVVLGVTLFGAFFIVMANLVVDVLYAVVDPKVRYS